MKIFEYLFESPKSTRNGQNHSATMPYVRQLAKH
ncbi:hypothetical protein FOQG_16448 [Fusarium oxysporum f. sp. raphani 54005]|uniref:Uncharacterized protein n=1 Tax=Fusarium oxysporum f. sp. raphani 54005 TaxID=1089458 RepID=X0C853_FUSOX|nr:hypothetical protein FOQG_16448 [Fusarium oxysporum f. sp. raphani 54005]